MIDIVCFDYVLDYFFKLFMHNRCLHLNATHAKHIVLVFLFMIFILLICVSGFWERTHNSS